MSNLTSNDRLRNYTELKYHGSIQDFDEAFEAGLVSIYDAYFVDPEEGVLSDVSSSLIFYILPSIKLIETDSCILWTYRCFRVSSWARFTSVFSRVSLSRNVCAVFLK